MSKNAIIVFFTMLSMLLFNQNVLFSQSVTLSNEECKELNRAIDVIVLQRINSYANQRTIGNKSLTKDKVGYRQIIRERVVNTFGFGCIEGASNENLLPEEQCEKINEVVHQVFLHTINSDKHQELLAKRNSTQDKLDYRDIVRKRIYKQYDSLVSKCNEEITY